MLILFGLFILLPMLGARMVLTLASCHTGLLLLHAVLLAAF